MIPEALKPYNPSIIPPDTTLNPVELTRNQLCRDIPTNNDPITGYPDNGSQVDSISISDISAADIEQLFHQVEIPHSRKIARYGKGFTVQSDFIFDHNF